MATPRTIKSNSEEAKTNKLKLLFLRSRGYNVPIDGSWGPWQDLLYLKEGLAFKPITLTDKATSVPLALPTSIATSGMVNPALGVTAALTLPLLDSDFRLTAKATAATAMAPFVRAYNKLASYFYPEDAPQAEGNAESKGNLAPSQPAQDSSTLSGTTSSASPLPERNDSNKKPSLRERIGDRIAGRKSGQSSNSSTPNSDLNGSFVKRLFWETRNNNFGPKGWQWRNVGRVGLYSSYPAREHAWPFIGSGIKYMAVGPDSIPPQLIQNGSILTTAQDTTTLIPTENYYETDPTIMEQIRNLSLSKDTVK